MAELQSWLTWWRLLGEWVPMGEGQQLVPTISWCVGQKGGGAQEEMSSCSHGASPADVSRGASSSWLCSLPAAPPSLSLVQIHPGKCGRFCVLCPEIPGFEKPWPGFSFIQRFRGQGNLMP